MKKHRVITITMDIDTEKHRADVRTTITENEEEKEGFSAAEALSIVSVLNQVAKNFLDPLRNLAVEREENKIENEK